MRLEATKEKKLEGWLKKMNEENEWQLIIVEKQCKCIKCRNWMFYGFKALWNPKFGFMHQNCETDNEKLIDNFSLFLTSDKNG